MYSILRIVINIVTMILRSIIIHVAFIVTILRSNSIITDENVPLQTVLRFSLFSVNYTFNTEISGLTPCQRFPWFEQ